MTKTIASTSDYSARIAKVRAAMVSKQVDAALLSVGHDLPYLSGYFAMPLGRVVGLEVRGAVRDQRVAGGVGLVERVLRGALVLVPHVGGDLGIDAVGRAALDEARLQRRHQHGVLLADRLA